MNSICRARLRNGVLSAAVTASVALGAGFLAVPAPAYAIWCENCSTFYQQMYQYAEEVNTAINTASQLTTQIQQYQNMVTQGTGLPDSMFGSIASDLQGVANIYSRSQALGRKVQNMDSQFNTSFPGFQSYLSSAVAADKTPASSTMPTRCRQQSNRSHHYAHGGQITWRVFY
jgi:type IV secretion system protein TrbJ